MRAATFCLGLILCVSGCGKKNAGPSPGPTTPTTPTPAVVSLTVSPSIDLLTLKATQALTATATLSNGTSSVVSPRWSTDSESVASVVNGILTGLAAGEATITADHEAVRAALRVRVLPDFGGRWTGSYRVASCSETLDWRGSCDDEDPNDLWYMETVLSQARDTVTSSSIAVFSDVTIPATGAVAINGALALGGIGSITSNGFVIEFRVTDWQSTTQNNQQMGGTFTVVISAPKFQGDYRLFCEFGATKDSAKPAGARGPGSVKRLRMPAKF